MTEGWVQVCNTRSSTGHHVTYELALNDGRVLRTRISHPPGRQTYGPSLWAHILRDQLGIAEEEFWACVESGVQPQRGTPEPRAEAIPAGLIHQLLAHGVPEAEIRTMTPAEAIQRMSDIWSTPS
jgi:hypothetical protein